MHVIITRPIEDSLELIKNLKIINHTITYLPLIEDILVASLVMT